MFQEIGAVRLRWHKDKVGYKLGKLRAVRDGREVLAPSIVPLSGPFGSRSEIVAGLGQHSIFTELAGTPETPEGALAFTTKWGCLRDTSAGLFLSDFYQSQAEIRALIKSAEGGRGPAAVIRHIQSKSFKVLRGLDWLAYSGLGLLKNSL